MTNSESFEMRRGKKSKPPHRSVQATAPGVAANAGIIPPACFSEWAAPLMTRSHILSFQMRGCVNMTSFNPHAVKPLLQPAASATLQRSPMAFKGGMSSPQFPTT
jgi:hypothetical protein